MTDPIADLLTRIRNAGQALVPSVRVRYSKLKESIASILKREGYISDFRVVGSEVKTLEILLKYEGRKSVVTGLKRVSRPGIRCYVSRDKIPNVLGGMGITILSTSKGVITGSEARRINVGGEVVCKIW